MWSSKIPHLLTFLFRMLPPPPPSLEVVEAILTSSFPLVEASAEAATAATSNPSSSLLAKATDPHSSFLSTTNLGHPRCRRCPTHCSRSHLTSTFADRSRPGHCSGSDGGKNDPPKVEISRAFSLLFCCCDHGGWGPRGGGEITFTVLLLRFWLLFLSLSRSPAGCAVGTDL